MLRNLENKGNPWGMADRGRDEWMAEPGLRGAPRRARHQARRRHRVPVLGRLRRRARGPLEEGHPSRSPSCCTPRVSSSRCSVPGETCTGDPARRLGNEFLFQMLGMQNVETLNSITRAGAAEDRRDLPALLQHPRQRVPAARRPLRGRAPHPAARPARRRRPAHAGRAGRQERHLPRPVLPRPAQQGVHAAARGAGCDPGTASQEMHRCKDRGFCCGAGGARFWMEEKIGKRINRRAHRRGDRPRSGPDLHRLPVLHGDAVRRRRPRSRPTARRKERPGARRRADPAAVARLHGTRFCSEARSRPRTDATVESVTQRVRFGRVCTATVSAAGERCGGIERTVTQ